MSYKCERKYNANIYDALNIIFLNERYIKFREKVNKNYLNSARHISVYVCIHLFLYAERAGCCSFTS